MKIVVLAGGISTERDVSLSSGSEIYKALKRKGHQVILVDLFLGLPGVHGHLEELFDSEIDWAASIRGVSEKAPVRSQGQTSRIPQHLRSKCTGALQSLRYCIPRPSWRRRRGRPDPGTVRSVWHPLHRNRACQQCSLHG